MRNTPKKLLSLALALMLCFSLFPLSAFAAESPDRGVLTYTEPISPQYEDAGQFSEGLAPVKKNGKWGYIDKDNKVVIGFQYELAYVFNEGLAIVSKSKETHDFMWDDSTYYELGFIDEKGNYTPFTGGMWAGYDEPLSVSERGLNLQDTTSIVFHNGVAVIDASAYNSAGKYIDVGESNWVQGPMNEGLMPIWNDWEGTAGWADANGNVVKMFSDDGNGTVIDYTYSFNQGLAPARQCSYNSETGEATYLWGFMDRNFQWAIQPQYGGFYYNGVYTDVKLFGVTGLAMMKKDGYYGAIDKNNNTVIPFQYEELWPVNSGLSVFKQSGKCGFLDAATLETAIPAQYAKASGFNSFGIAVVYNGQKAFLIDKTGSQVPGADALDPSVYFIEYEDGHETVYTPGEYVVIERGGKYGFGHIEYLQPLPDPSEMSPWAYEEVVAAIEEDLVPSGLQNLYRNNITRNEFCSLIVQTVAETLEQDIADVVQEQTGKSLSAWQRTYPFTDTSDSDIIAASSLGIINGRGNGVFDPYTTISRQEAATMLTRAAKVLGMNTANAPAADFSDSGSMADWSRDAINFVSRIGVMRGMGDSTFAPYGTYSREQSYMTAHRLFQAVLGESNDMRLNGSVRSIDLTSNCADVSGGIN